MNITALIENQSDCGLSVVHGLSLYIETSKHRILFDLGPDKTLFKNSRQLGVDLTQVDTVILSHGHYDHGGALEEFLAINRTAAVYAQRKAFEPHYSKTAFLNVSIGIPPHLQTHPQVTLLDGDHTIDDELRLFTTPYSDRFRSSANDTLYAEAGKDDFSHEQNLMILGDCNVLIMGCGHAGAVNILEKAMSFAPKVCIGGYHLWNPATKRTVSSKQLEVIARELTKYDIHYYTCHCTGQKAYGYLAERVPKMEYLSCGRTIVL